MRLDRTLVPMILLMAVLLGVFLWGLARYVVVPAVDPTPTPPPAAVVTILPATSPLPAQEPLVFVTATTREPVQTMLPTATATPVPTETPEPTPTPTRVPQTPIQRG